MKPFRQSAPRGLDLLLLWGAIAALLVLAAVVGGALLYRSRMAFQINYNEGWNSYFTGRVLDGLPLYPGRDTRLVNNYPPLSFLITAAVSKLGGGVLEAGRAIAWSSLFACMALLAVAARRMGASLAGTLFAPAFFAALMATRYDLYVGMFDPQLPGHAVMLCGLVVLLCTQSAGGAVVAALLMVAGGFIKHSLVALPAATAVWLLWTDRRLFLAFLLAGAVGVAGGLLACSLAYGPEFLNGLLLPRQSSAAEAFRKLVRWLEPLQVPLALAALPCVLGGVQARLVGLYLLTALVEAALGAAPFATNYNMVFDLALAMSLGLGLLTGGWAARVPPGWAAAAAAGCIYVSAAQLATAETTSWAAWSAVQRGRDAAARAAVAELRAQPGPALCGDLLLCFLAGKPFLYDPLNYGRAPGETQAALREELDRHGFAIVQTSGATNFLLPETTETIMQRYTPLPGHSGLAVPLPNN